jgi:uncharacterized protein YjbI with pentapeptide repeats
MSDEQNSQPDDSEPTPERQAELRAVYDKNMAAGRPPYAGAEIHTRGELHWVVQERGWSDSPVRLAKVIDLREADLAYADLSGAYLTDANLSGAFLVKTNLGSADLTHADLTCANLRGANLHGATLNFAILTGATLNRADLTSASLVAANLLGATLNSANLSGADLGAANLSDANLIKADLSDANLAATILSGAILGNANLSGADLVGSNLNSAVLTNTNLSGANLAAANLSAAYLACDLKEVNLAAARMDSATLLGTSERPVSLDTTTLLLDVAWNGASLASVQWDQVPRLGDEADMAAAKTTQERIKAYSEAARSYRGLAKALQDQGLTDPALRYRQRQYKWERRALLTRGKFGSWIFSWLLNLVSSYGDRPGRALACYVSVVSVFAAVYYIITNGFFAFITSHSTALQWYEALVLSVSSFHGRGFFPSVPSLGDPVAIVAAFEAIIGLFIELVFIATFTQRFFAR